jgi:hypothetical protein
VGVPECSTTDTVAWSFTSSVIAVALLGLVCVVLPAAVVLGKLCVYFRPSFFASAVFMALPSDPVIALVLLAKSDVFLGVTPVVQLKHGLKPLLGALPVTAAQCAV